MMEEQINQSIEQLVFFPMFQKYMKDLFIVNYPKSSKYHCGFHESFSTQHIFLVMLKKIKARFQRKNCTVVLIDLWKAFDCFCQNTLKLIYV